MKEFNCKRFKMTIGDNLLKNIVVKQGEIFGEEDLIESKKLSEAYLPNTKFFVLLEGEQDASVSNPAKRLAATKEYTQYTAALALCGSNLSTRIMGNLFLKINKPLVRTRYFENREEALVWLKQQMTSP